MAATASAMPLPLAGHEKGQEERALVQRAQKGDERAFEQLVRQHQQRVFGLVARILHRQDDVEDIAQQVFLKVYLSLGRFDQRAAFSTWLYKIAVNECWDHLRKKKVRPLLYESDLSEEQVSQLDGIASRGRTTEGFDQQAEARDTLNRVLEILPEQDRELLLLKEVEGFSVQELAEILGLNVNTVKVRLFRARGKIMEMQRRRSGVGGSAKGPSTAAERKPGAQ
jgi:RNA polymerase sigma-70 factor (ECF subfamily)